jgi:hypothetical protein
MTLEQTSPVKTNQSIIENIVLITISLLLFIPLLWHAFIGLYSRYVADDFCYVSEAQHAGVAHLVVHSYLNWTGRFTYPAVIGLLSSFDYRVAGILAVVTLGLWLVAVYFLTSFLLRAIFVFRHHRLVSLILSELIVFATLAFYGESNDIGQITYWYTGVIIYTLPLAVLIGNLALMMYGTGWIGGNSRWRLVLIPIVFLASIFIGGSSEPLAVIQIVLLMIFWWFCRLFGSDSSQRAALNQLLIFAAVGAVISLVLEVAAPGNYARQEVLTEATAYQPRPELVLPISIFSTFLFLAAYLSEARFAVVLMLILPAALVICFRYEARTRVISAVSKRIVWAMPLSLIMITAINFAPAAYALGTVPSRRSMLAPAFLWAIGIIVWGMFLGIQIQQSAKPNQATTSRGGNRGGMAALAICVGLLVWHTVSHYEPMRDRIAESQAFAADWDQVNVTLQRASDQGEKDVIIALPQNIWKLDDGREDSTFWLNGCMAYFYDLDSVTGLPAQP